MQIRNVYRPRMSDGPDVQPDKVRGGEGVEGGRDPHQVRLLVPDPVEEPDFANR